MRRRQAFVVMVASAVASIALSCVAMVIGGGGGWESAALALLCVSIGAQAAVW